MNEEMGKKVVQRFLDGIELAEYIGASKKFVEKHVSNGRMPGVVKVGRLTRFDKEIIDRRLLSGQLLLEGQRG